MFWSLTFVTTQKLVSEHCAEVRFASCLSGGYTTITAVINPPERRLAKCTSVHCCINWSKHAVIMTTKKHPASLARDRFRTFQSYTVLLYCETAKFKETIRGNTVRFSMCLDFASLTVQQYCIAVKWN